MATFAIQRSTRVEARWRDAGHGAGIVDAEEDGAAGGVREGNQLTREVFGVGGQDATVAETKDVELGQTVLAGAELVQNLVSRVEHRLVSRSERSESSLRASHCAVPRGARRSYRKRPPAWQALGTVVRPHGGSRVADPGDDGRAAITRAGAGSTATAWRNSATGSPGMGGSRNVMLS